MANPTYKWKRYWVPRNGIIPLSSDGFLEIPDSEIEDAQKPKVVSLTSVSSTKCLILLGENGIGKTNAMNIEKKVIDSRIRRHGGESLWLDLHRPGSEEELERSLLQSRTFKRWAKGKHDLYLFLDSLDVALLRVDEITGLLSSELGRYPVKRLYLRIACRTAPWPSDLEKALTDLFGNENVGVYELAPLRKEDVKEAASANGVDPNAFLNEIARVGVAPFAIKPLSFGLLIKLFQRDGRLVSTKGEIYLDGCRLLCEERGTNPLHSSHRHRTTSADHRLAIASRIAAATVYGNRFAIWTGIDVGDAAKEDVLLRDLIGLTEHIDGSRFDVAEQAAWETLDTGLFSARDMDRLGWSHQSYAEFLAARYVIQNKLTTSQAMSLITHPNDPECRIVPQLQETAAWLAGMSHDLFREILRVDPKALLLSDIAKADDNDRAALVQDLLELFDQERLIDSDWQMRRLYAKLANSHLAEQLRPYVRDKKKGIIVRRVATDIAEECGVRELEQDLADVALDGSDDHSIRVNAAYAVNRLASEEVKKQLKPLAFASADDDPDGQLKGIALMAVWPRHISTKELFDALTPPRTSLFLGAYRAFLSPNVVDQIPLNDLPVALKWVEAHSVLPVQLSPLSGIDDALMIRSWENLEDPLILAAFASAVKVRLAGAHGIVGEFGSLDGQARSFRDDLISSDSKRHQLLLALLPLLDDFAKQWVWLLYSSTPLVLDRDVPWMVEQLSKADTNESREQWAQLIERSASWHKPKQLKNLILQVGTYRPLVDALRKLKSSYAARVREQRKWRKPTRRPLLKPTPEERINQRLNECEQDSSFAWWLLNREMTLEPTSEYYGKDFESDLTSLPGWKSSDKKTKSRIIGAANRFLREQDPKVGEWLGTNTVYFPALAGYRALELLLRRQPSFLAKLPTAIWKKWAPVIPTFPNKDGIDSPVDKALLKHGYIAAPDEITRTYLARIDQDNASHRSIFFSTRLDDIWDERLADALFLKLNDPSLSPGSIGVLLSSLLSHQHGPTREYASSLLALSSSAVEDERLKAQEAASALMVCDTSAGWSLVWPKFQADADFGRAVITEIAEGPDRRAEIVGEKLNEEQLADLYIWLETQFPHAEDPQPEGFHAVSSRESIAMWRDSLIRHLRTRGTPQATEAIQRLVQELPHLRWLRCVLLETRDFARRAGWTAPTPRDIVKLSADQELRLVQSGSQLLSIIQESLARLQAKLKGENTGAQFLWNEAEPKNEAAFSDFVKMHLEDDLVGRAIILNRETQIHRVQRTDIHVDAVSKRPEDKDYERIKAIIEAKGCWNPKLGESMKTQLVEQYLAENDCQNGVYLVGWFNCKAWTKKGGRRTTAKKLCPELNEARKRLEQQAHELSKDGLDIRAIALDASLPEIKA